MKPAILRFLMFCGALLAALPETLSAAPPALTVINAARPVEVQHQGQRRSLGSDLVIQPGDEIITGADGRATLRFDELVLTVGADSVLVFANSEEAAGGRPPVLRLQLQSGVLRVDGRAGRGGPQDLRLNAADLRMRVLGSDVWIAVDDAQRTVCLIDGAVELQSVQGPQRLDYAGDCLFADRDGVRVRRPEPADLVGRLALTEYPRAGAAIPRGVAVSPTFSAGGGVPGVTRPMQTLPPAPTADVPLPPADNGPKTGGWTLVALALGDGESAKLEALTFTELGLPSQVRPYKAADGRQLYRVTIGSFATRQQALAYNELLKTRFGLNQLWAASY